MARLWQAGWTVWIGSEVSSHCDALEGSHWQGTERYEEWFLGDLGTQRLFGFC